MRCKAASDTYTGPGGSVCQCSNLQLHCVDTPQDNAAWQWCERGLTSCVCLARAGSVVANHANSDIKNPGYMKIGSDVQATQIAPESGGGLHAHVM